MTAIKRTLGQLRQARGLDQKQMARAMGWTGKMAFLRISAFESGRLMPSEGTAKDMALVLNVSVEVVKKLAFKAWWSKCLEKKGKERS